MGPDNMPRPFAPEHSEKMTHVEVLRNKVLPRLMYEEEAALTAAIKALEAVEKAASGEVWTNAVSGFVDEPDGTRVLILPADAVGGG